MTNTDLTNCDHEPIHIPGKIQGHGFLVAFNHGLEISYCSENISEFVPVTANLLLRTPVLYFETVILEQPEGFVGTLIKKGQSDIGFHPVNPYPIILNERPFNLIICASGDQYFLEFEPALSDLKLDLQQHIGSSLSEMLTNSNLTELFDKAASQIRKIIEYDRVMVYKFYDDGHGEVIAEAKNDELKPWLALHFPASDIPRQARELYKLNLVRLIADVESTPSDILIYSASGETPLDLTHSALRAVSPIHIQYLKNMGVASSFSVSLLHQGELWGLVSCHNYSPRFIDYKQREAAKLIGQLLSTALSFRQQEEDHKKSSRLKNAVDDLTSYLQRYDSIDQALFKQEVTLLDAVEADGAVLVYDNHFYQTGITPDVSFLQNIVDWIPGNIQETIYATDRLPMEYHEAIAHKATASGMLVCRLSKEPGEYMIWFRPEVALKIRWAGNPEKPVELNENGLAQISPRKSFESWSQQVKLTSAPWKNEDFRSALQLKEEVAFAIRRKAAQVRILNEKLKEAYDELDAFSYTISHDLKNPLTAIKSYAQLLKRQLKLGPREERMLNGVLSEANRMHAMIDEVLNYSRAGQIKAILRFVDMTVLLHDLKEQLLLANEFSQLTIDIGPTPNIFGDKTMIQQVFSNLLGNAVKYSGKTALPKVAVSGEQIGGQVQYLVNDNGIGIKLNDREKIFDLFTRSDDVDEFEGSGVGLAIVKKIMEKHKGRVWVESGPDAGATFHVSFQNEGD